jgi:Protein of unknown function (DUF2630)
LGHLPAGETCPVVATFERKVRPRSDPRKEGEEMARSEILQKIEDLSEERERLLAREGSHHAGAGDHRRLADIDHSLGVLWDLRRRELAGEDVGLDEDFLDRYVISPGDDAPDDYTWAR